MQHRPRRSTLPRLGVALVACLLLGSGGLVGPVDLSGSWRGTTEQGHPISLEISEGALVSFSIAYEVHGEGCTLKRSTAATFPEPLALTGTGFGFSTTSGALRLSISGRFSSASEVSGRAEFTLSPAEGAACTGSSATAWSATRQ